MNKQTIPLYIALLTIGSVLIGYYMALLGLVYISANSLDHMLTDLYELEISSLLDFVFSVFLLASSLFLTLILILLLSSAPYVTKQIVTIPFRSQDTHRLKPPTPHI